MATRLKKNKKPGKGGKIALKVFIAALLMALLTVAAGMINASVVRIRRAEVFLTDLPPAFDGVTALYASDIDLFGLNTPQRSGELFNRLQSLKPDLLLKILSDMAGIGVPEARIHRLTLLGCDAEGAVKPLMAL